MVDPKDLADEMEDFDLTNVDDCNKLIEKYNFQLAVALKDVWVLKRMLQLISEKYLDKRVLEKVNEEAVEDLNKTIQGAFEDE